ncbi:MAG: hypothetical protein Q8R81_09440 [Novosphingobium sp.]|uniref:hypothetical protein n=1 Tax=Novosphingobium sp. TaxID=1874826 RepID=UPI0027352376|nr:hypothetical protein [Novosphingobium sp.]MDP3550607.1 hypothetical protein [Novosphingobium sp.]
MRSAFLILTIALSACATPQDIYNGEVDFDEVTAKPMAEVSQCMQLRYASAPITTPDGKIGFAIKNGFQQVLGLITLEPAKSGTRIQVRQTGQAIINARDYRNCM